MTTLRSAWEDRELFWQVCAAPGAMPAYWPKAASMRCGTLQVAPTSFEDITYLCRRG